MQRKVRIATWAAIAVLVVLTGGIVVYESLRRGGDGATMASMSIGAPFSLVDHNGSPITEAAMKGDPAAVFFGFTHCPEVCPTSLWELSVWLDTLGEEGEHINAFFFTVDPERDTPEMLKHYVEAFGDRIVGVTGDPEAMAALAKAWHVYWRKVPLEDGEYTMDHTASIFLVDGNGAFRGTIAFGENSESAVAKLQRLAAG